MLQPHLTLPPSPPTPVALPPPPPSNPPPRLLLFPPCRHRRPVRPRPPLASTPSTTLLLHCLLWHRGHPPSHHLPTLLAPLPPPVHVVGPARPAVPSPPCRWVVRWGPASQHAASSFKFGGGAAGGSGAATVWGDEGGRRDGGTMRCRVRRRSSPTFGGGSGGATGVGGDEGGWRGLQHRRSLRGGIWRWLNLIAIKILTMVKERREIDYNGISSKPNVVMVKLRSPLFPMVKLQNSHIGHERS